MDTNFQVTADHNLEIASRCFVWSAKIAGFYFISRFVAVLLSYSIFAFALGSNFYLLPNVLVPVFCGLFWIALHSMRALSAFRQNKTVQFSLTAATVCAVCLFIYSMLFSVFSLLPTNTDSIALWAGWGELITFLVWVLSALSLLCIGIFLSAFYNQQLLTGTTCTWIFLGIFGTIANWLTIYPFAQNYMLPITFVLIIGTGWYFGLLQIEVLLMTGKDQQMASF